MKPIIVKLLAAAGFAVVLVYASLPTGSAAETLAGGSLQLAGLKCGMENGKFVCENTSGHKNHDDGDDDHDHDKKKNDDDDHDHGKKQKDDTSGLETCTIQQPNSGGGCKTGFKRVCEKMKSGKKCCGCVEDKNAKKEEPAKPKLFTCSGQVRSPAGGAPMPGPSGPFPGNSSAEAQVRFREATAGLIPEGPVTCTPIN